MTRTTVIISAAIAAASLALAGCGSGSTTGASTPISISATDYVTIPPTPTTIAAPTTLPDLAGTIIPDESTYVVQAGDYPSTIAQRFKVDFNEFLKLNDWTLDANGIAVGFPGVGQPIKIPAGATVPGIAPPTVPTTAGEDTATATTTPVATDAPSTTVNDCAAGTYVILADDTSRQKVATKFDVTVASLDAVNANTKGYSMFYPGLKIIIPAKKAGC